MHSLRNLLRRTTTLRPLGPPRNSQVAAQARVFASRAPLLLVSRAGPRPQLPYLSPSFVNRQLIPAARLLSTEQKQYIRYQLKLGAYWTLLGWVVIGGLATCYFVLREDWLNRLYPSPEDWGWLAKHNWRKARHEEEEEVHGRGMTDWAIVGSSFRAVYILCEEGSGVRAWATPLPKNVDWDRSVPGVDEVDIAREPNSPLSEVSKIGCDISEKSEQWRRAYFHALMGMAKASEMNVGWVRDKKRRLLFPADQMVGPSNPYPKPLWPGSPAAPLEEDCEQAYDSPNLWYTRILTTKGLSRDQRLAASLAYASYSDFAGDTSTASALYKWSLALAAADSDRINNVSAESGVLLDSATGVLSASAPFTTPNILATATALASHEARTGSLTPALNIYLSVLRARRSSPSELAAQFYPSKGPDLTLSNVDSILRWITSLPFGTPMPPAPPSGDLPFHRTAASQCEDAAIMNYVGEILFATATGSKQRREALSWTRDAVGVAEVGQADAKLDAKDKRVCTQCLGTGLENWYRMVSFLAREEDAGAHVGPGADTSVKTPIRSSWSLWAPFGSSDGNGGSVGIASAETNSKHMLNSSAAELYGEWKKEEEMVAKRRAAFSEAKLMAQLNRHISTKSNWFVV